MILKLTSVSLVTLVIAIIDYLQKQALLVKATS